MTDQTKTPGLPLTDQALDDVQAGNGNVVLLCSRRSHPKSDGAETSTGTSRSSGASLIAPDILLS